MAFEDNMQEAVQGGIASSAEYNKVVRNVRWVHQRNQDQDAWMTAHLDGVSEANASHATINSRLDALEVGGGGGAGGLLVVRLTSSTTSVATTQGGGGEISWPWPAINTVDATVSGQRITVGRTGWYALTAQAALESASDETVGLYVLKGATTTSGSTDGVVVSERPSKNGLTAFQIAGAAYFEVGDVLKIRVYRDGGASSLVVRGTANAYSYGGTFFSMQYIAAPQA